MTKIDLFVDLNSQDDTGLPWTYADQAADPTEVLPGRYLVVGAGNSVAVAEIVDRAEDGLVHVRPLAGTVKENLHLRALRGAA